MEEITYQEYGTKGSEAATIGIYQLAKAIEKDMRLQGRSFKPHTYNNWIKDSMNPSNKTGFKQGIRMGEILFKGEQWESSYGKTKGEDLARAIVYTLRNQGVYDWPNVRECVKAMPSPFNKLYIVEYEPEGIEASNVKSALEPVLNVNRYDEAMSALKKAEKMLIDFKKSENKNITELKKRESQLLTYANHMRELSQENETLRIRLIEKLTDEVEHLTRNRHKVTDPKDLKALDKAIKEAENQLKKLNYS